jgi:hypothetical protein
MKPQRIEVIESSDITWSMLTKIQEIDNRIEDTDDIIVLRMNLLDDAIDECHDRFSKSSLNKVGEKCIGKTVYTDSGMTVGKIFTFSVVSNGECFDSSKNEATTILYAFTYLMKRPEIEKFVDTIIKKKDWISHFSCSVLFSECSVCMDEITQCEHISGKYYDGALCYRIIQSIVEIYSINISGKERESENMIDSYIRDICFTERGLTDYHKQEIKKITGKEPTDKDTIVISMTLATDAIDWNSIRFTENALENLRNKCIGHYGYDSYGFCIGTIFDAYISEFSNKMFDSRNNYPTKKLTVLMFAENNTVTRHVIDRLIIEENLFIDMSINYSTSKCSICKRDTLSKNCVHKIGDTYDGIPCYRVVDRVDSFIEFIVCKRDTEKTLPKAIDACNKELENKPEIDFSGVQMVEDSSDITATELYSRLSKASKLTGLKLLYAVKSMIDIEAYCIDGKEDNINDALFSINRLRELNGDKNEQK